MFDSPYDFFSLVIAIAALIFARKAFNQTAALRARMDSIEALAASAAAARPGPPPLTLELEQTLAASSPDIAAEQPATPADVEPIAPAAEDNAADSSAADTAAMPPPLPQPDPGFEERIGTRWVVWVGGLTLALGGFFIVRYSIYAR